MMDWQKVQGSQETRPEELDTTSSAFYVYQRKNIERVTVEDSMTGDSYEVWQYDERKLTRDEFILESAKQTRADIDFIAAMSDLDL